MCARGASGSCAKGSQMMTGSNRSMGEKYVRNRTRRKVAIRTLARAATVHLGQMGRYSAQALWLSTAHKRPANQWTVLKGT